jgi:hypothetical protein
VTVPSVCPRCGTPIKPRQLYVARTGTHVACPSPREVAHAERMGRLVSHEDGST